MFNVTCPSGLQGVVRGLKVKDEQLFANKELIRSGKLITRVLENCWLETTNVGPYAEFKTKPDFSKLAGADRTYLIIQIRIKTYGSKYDFSATCKTCGYRFIWGIELAELDTIPMSPEGISQLQTNVPIPVTSLSEGLTAHLRVSTGEDEEFIAEKNVAEDEVLTWNLARRISSINGKTSWFDILPEVQDLGAADADELWNASDTLEGGVETSFDIKCPKCKEVQPVVLPFEAAFFSNRKRFARSSTRRTG